MKRRIFILLFSTTLLLSVFLFRLFWIQVIGVQRYSEHKINLVQQSVLQRGKAIMLDDGRADFYDRHNVFLTGTPIHALAVFPLKQYDSAAKQRMRELAKVLDVPIESWLRYLEKLKEPELWSGLAGESSTPRPLSEDQIKKIVSLNMNGLYVVPYNLRYNKPFLASHLIGFIGQNPLRVQAKYEKKLEKGQLALSSVIGAAGLELSLDRYLHGIDPTTLALFTDANDRPLQGLSARITHPRNKHYPLKAITTIDKTIQEQIEATVDELDMKQGAVVVLDVTNADVVAMVSRPQYDPNNVVLAKGDWANKSLKATVPGSVFKIVVAAAALEGRYVTPGELFFCDGALGKYQLSCWKKGGHGHISLEQAFIESCNVTFAKVIERISSTELEAIAKQLGLMQTVGWSRNTIDLEQHFSQFDAEEKGKVFAVETPQHDGGVRAQTAIGQRDVMLTPLQAANLIVTLLHDGEVKSPRVVKELRYYNNKLATSFPEKVLLSKKKGISKQTARTLLHWMEGVVEKGTGKALQDAQWKLAGKSGTAQVVLRGRPSENQWFVGYGPVEKARYAVAVLVQNQGPTHEATKVFHRVMDRLSVL